MYKAVRYLSGALNGAPLLSFTRINKTWVVIAGRDKRTNLLYPCVHISGISFSQDSIDT
jgi:hypothetical protein